MFSFGSCAIFLCFVWLHQLRNKLYIINYWVDFDQVFHNDKDHHILVAVVQTRMQQIQDGRRPPFLKSKTRDISQTVYGQFRRSVTLMGFPYPIYRPLKRTVKMPAKYIGCEIIEVSISNLNFSEPQKDIKLEFGNKTANMNIKLQYLYSQY